MSVKYSICFYIIVFLFLPNFHTAATAITIDELAGICEKMESAIVDINIEYEWYRDTPLTLEEQLKDANEKGYLLDIGPAMCKLSAARLLAGRDQNSTVFDRYYLEMSTTLINKNKEFWDGLTKISYDGKVTKHLSIDEFPQRSSAAGTIASGREFKNYMQPINLTPIGFSIFHQGIRNPNDKLLLADILRDKKEFARINSAVEKINGFNAIRADLLTENDPKEQFVYCRIYFSVDHGYTPVRYEYTYKSGRIALAFDVQSLEQIAKGLWFPSSGVINDPDSEIKSGFRTTDKILVNQGLADKDFDIEFPVGTKVYDRINDRGYIVKPADEQPK
jgi:hypothetical protein